MSHDLCFGGRPSVLLVLGTFLVLIWTFRLLDVPEVFTSLIAAFERGDHQVHYQNANDADAEAAFVRQAMSVEFPVPIDHRPIQEVCSRSEFRPGLLFTCEEQHGGVGMVRNQMLRCIRYAISAGAAIVVPSMQLRNASDISDIETRHEVPLDYLFDRATFLKHLSTGCPEMRIYERAEDFPSYTQRQLPLTVTGDQFEPDHPPTGLRHPREWRRHLDAWLAQNHLQIHPNAPVHVRVGQSYLEYPVRDDGDAFAREFGKLLSFRKDTCEMAAKVLWGLKKRFSLSTIDPALAINSDAYYGAHLRLEQDAISAWPPEDWRFGRMEDQFEEQMRNIARHERLNVVYVASGNQTVVDVFGERLAAYPALLKQRRNVTLVTKHDLLKDVDLRRLNAFTFDQQALVDFLVMFKASVFMGVAHSSFPWTVALRRHEMSKYRDYANEGSDLLRDEYSIIMGMAKDYPQVDPFVYGVWP